MIGEQQGCDSPGLPESGASIVENSARHPGAWRLLLPRMVAGPVVLANLDPVTTEDLLRSFPDAVVLWQASSELPRSTRTAIWDGRESPLAPGSIELIVCDDRDGVCAAALAPALRRDGQQVAIVPSSKPYRFALFPTPEHLRAVIGRGWPITYESSPRKWLGYWLATTPHWRRLSRSGLAIRWPNDSVVDAVLHQLSTALGERVDLRGIISGRGLGQLTLRVRCSERDLAVRLAASSDSVRRLRNRQRVMAELSVRLGSQNVFTFPESVASGSEEGISWAAVVWQKSRPIRAGRAWRPSWVGWSVLQAIAAELGASAQTGRTTAGWAQGWVNGLGAIAPELVDEVVSALAPVESAGMTTAWCHGDLWPGNVLLRRPPELPVVIDWDRARSDAPAGLDAIFAEVSRIVIVRRCYFGEAAAWLAQFPTRELNTREVGGRSYASQKRPQQHGLLLATVIHYVTGENEGEQRDRWTQRSVEQHLLPLITYLRETQ